MRSRLNRLPIRPAASADRLGAVRAAAGACPRARRPAHALAFVSPIAWRGKSVVTVYDLSFLRFPEVYNGSNRLYLGTFTPPSLRRADRVITISEDARAT